MQLTEEWDGRGGGRGRWREMRKRERKKPNGWTSKFSQALIKKYRNSVLKNMRPGPSFHFTLDLVTFRTCCHTFSGLSVHCHPRNIPFPHVGASICGVPCLFYGLYPSLWGALHLVDSRKLCHGTGLGEMLLPQPTRRWGELPPALPLRLTPTTGTFWEVQTASTAPHGAQKAHVPGTVL